MSRKLYRNICIGFLAFCFNSALFSQSEINPLQQSSPNIGVIYKQETAFRGQLHTRGFGFGFHKGKIKTYYKTIYNYIDLTYIKHQDEHKPENLVSFNGLSRPYVYGKRNSLWALKVGWGKKIYLSEKAKRKGFAVGYSYEFGPSIGLIKPYYLDLRTEQTRINPISEKYSEANADRFLNTFYVEGPSGFWKGIGETEFTIGGNANIAAHFAWGAYDELVKALSVGLKVDVFAERIPIMILEKNRPYFVNLYITLQFGKRK